MLTRIVVGIIFLAFIILVVMIKKKKDLEDELKEEKGEISIPAKVAHPSGKDLSEKEAGFELKGKPADKVIKEIENQKI